MFQGQNVPRDKTSQETKRPTPNTKLKKTHFVLENWPHALDTGPHPCTQFMIRVQYSYFGEVTLGHSCILAILD